MDLALHSCEEAFLQALPGSRGVFPELTTTRAIHSFLGPEGDRHDPPAAALGTLWAAQDTMCIQQGTATRQQHSPWQRQGSRTAWAWATAFCSQTLQPSDPPASWQASLLRDIGVLSHYSPRAHRVWSHQLHTKVSSCLTSTLVDEGTCNRPPNPVVPFPTPFTTPGTHHPIFVPFSISPLLYLPFASSSALRLQFVHFSYR